MLAAFGQKVFQVSNKKIYTFQDYSRSSTLAEEDVEVLGKKPSTHIKGPGLDSVTFVIALNANLGVNVEQEIASWISVKDSQKPQLLTIGNSPVSTNKFLITQIQESEVVINNKGKKIKAKMTLTLKEYVRAGTPPKKEKASSQVSPSEQALIVEQLLNADKSESKRTNPAAEAAKNNPYWGKR
jgi:phage protein U